MRSFYTSRDTEYKHKKLQSILVARFSEKNLSSLLLFLSAPAEPHWDLHGPKLTGTHERVFCMGQP